MTRKSIFWLVVTASLCLVQIARAQDYRPDVLEIDATQLIVFEANDAYTIADCGTLEFWVVADWNELPDFDPVILANVGADGASYIIAITAERDGVLITSGEEEVFFNFDFADGKLHHFALSQFQDGIMVVIDGQAIGESAMMLQAFDSVGLFIGSLDDASYPFLGAIAALRFWDYVPDYDTLVGYARRSVYAPEHPFIDQLSAMSNFDEETMQVLQEID